MFIAASCIIAKKEKLSKYSLTDEQINKVGHIHTVDITQPRRDNICYNMYESWTHYAKGERPETKAHIHKIYRTGKSIETESELTVARGLGESENGE